MPELLTAVPVELARMAPAGLCGVLGSHLVLLLAVLLLLLPPLQDLQRLHLAINILRSGNSTDDAHIGVKVA